MASDSQMSYVYGRISGLQDVCTVIIKSLGNKERSEFFSSVRTYAQEGKHKESQVPDREDFWRGYGSILEKLEYEYPVSLVDSDD